MLDDRKAAVLQALVVVYIRTGEPVSSRAVLEATGLHVSSATIRNELVSLERDGYVAQPHTSAGRIPTDAGYRYYVDHLSAYRLRSRIQEQIEQFFSTFHDELESMLQRTSDLLADITHLPALVLGPALASEPIHAVHLVPVGGRMVLSVIVTGSGRVTKEAFRLPAKSEPDDLDDAEELLNQLCVGSDLPTAAAATGGREGPAFDIARVAMAASARSTVGGTDVFLGGTNRLAGLWADLAEVQRVLDLLEHQAALQEILEGADEGTMVRIGSELPIEDADISLVASSYEGASGAGGRLGVLGPTRMDYRRTIRVVEEVSEGLGDSLGT